MERFFVETLGCPKNAVDSEKLTAGLLADGLVAAASPADADLVVVNTCAFIEDARRDSIDTALALADAKAPGARLVVTGCLAERYGGELAAALPEADAVVGFAGAGTLADVLVDAPRRKPAGVRDLLDMPRPAPRAPWAYLKVAEGCDRACAFCAIPSFRGRQRSRDVDAVEAEARGLVERGVVELVLVAQDLARYGRDAREPDALVALLQRLDRLRPHGLARVRLLYLYPSEVRERLVRTMLELPTVVPYFDLSLQHASPGLLRRMRRWGGAARFEDAIARIRAREPDAAFRSSFIVGFPGETEDDHETLLSFLGAVELDWAGFFRYSAEDGTPAASLGGAPDAALVAERLRECSEIQDPITASRRDRLVGDVVEALVDRVDAGPPGRAPAAIARTHREAPEIDGVVRIERSTAGAGSLVPARVTAAIGPDLLAQPVAAARPA